MIRLLLLVLFFVMAIYGGCWAQIYSDTDTLGVDPVSGFPNDTISIAFNLVNDFAVGGFQIRSSFDDTTFRPIDMHLASRSQLFDLFGAYFDQPGVASFYGTSWNPIQNAITPGSGDIAILRFAILPDAQPGLYDIRFEDTDSVSHENSLSNIWGDSLIIPILVDREIQVLPASGTVGETPVPMSIGLAQNYPNPFNGITRISFTLDKPQMIDLSVFDMLGRSVALIYSGWMSAGEHVVYWDSESAGKINASGSYFYRLKASRSGALTRMMTLLK